MRLLITLLLLTGFSLLSVAQQNIAWETYYEKSGFLETPRYDKTIRYCRQLADASPSVHYMSFGTSCQGRELPLLIVDKKGNFDPAAVHRTNNLVVLIQACIHPGEPDGKDAGLALIRDMVITKSQEKLLENVTLLFIPILNVDGHERFGPFNRINQNGPLEMGWRTNAQNLNLNRDFLKAESPEIQSWLRLFNEWLPEFFIDCHTTNGADYQYPLTYGLEIYGTMDEDLTRWQKESYLKEVESLMAASGMPISPYVQFRKWHDPRSGMHTGASPPMLSHGYTALQNRPSLLIETHMLKDYKTRVDATYEIIRHSLRILNREYHQLEKLVREADRRTASPEFRTRPLAVQFETSGKDSVMTNFKGVRYDVLKSDLSGGDWFRYSKDTASFRVPFFNRVVPKVLIDLPEAYIIPAEWKSLAQKLSLHGISYSSLNRETKVMVTSYRMKNPKFRATPYEGRQTVEAEYEVIREERVYPANSLIVRTGQRSSRVIAGLLEPGAATSLLWWGYFNTIFEQKEYAESYVMEEMARKMIIENPDLQKELEAKRASDPQFGKQAWDLLNWFYAKTPYWDTRKDMFPIGKIFDAALLESLLQ